MIAARARLAWLGSVAVLLAACGGSVETPGGTIGNVPFTNVPAPANGVAEFSVLPVAIAPGLTLTALGNLNPPGHVLPTDHAYFYDWDLSVFLSKQPTDARTVYVPATGAVFFVLQPSGTDYKVMFRATENFYFYLDHVQLTAPVTVGQVIQAGTKIGTTSPGGTLDIGAFDMTVSHAGFVNPARYGAETLHYVSPWKYFTPALQAELYPHVYRAPTAADKDGRIDLGVAGTLAGDWFLLGMPVDSTNGPYGWPRSVSFATDYYDPSQVRISIGGTVAPPGVWGIDPSAPRPETVTPATGPVAYRLFNFHDVQPQYGLMLVQLTDPSTLRIEVFVGSSAGTAQFDDRAFTFVR